MRGLIFRQNGFIIRQRKENYGFIHHGKNGQKTERKGGADPKRACRKNLRHRQGSIEMGNGQGTSRHFLIEPLAAALRFRWPSFVGQRGGKRKPFGQYAQKAKFMFVPFAEMSSEHSARRRCAAAGWSCPDNRPNSPTTATPSPWKMSRTRFL